MYQHLKILNLNDITFIYVIALYWPFQRVLQLLCHPLFGVHIRDVPHLLLQHDGELQSHILGEQHAILVQVK